MTQRDPSEPSRLLEDLESIRNLLDEHGEHDQGEPDAEASAQLDIPLLQDIVTDPAATPPTLREPEPAPAPGPAVTAAPEPTDAGKPHNPFLPYASLAKLAEERLQLDRLLSNPTLPPSHYGPHTGAREVRMEARLQAEAQLILQDVLDDLMPTIEDELRRRLQRKLDQLVREQLK